MEVRAKIKFLRMSSRKVRLVADTVRGLNAKAAADSLRFMKKRAAGPVGKLLKSAMANALNDFELSENNLYIKEIRVDEGPTLRRWMPRARGRATPLRKRMSHISLTLGELVESGRTGAKKKKIEAPVKLGAKPKEDEGVKIEGKREEARADRIADEAKGIAGKEKIVDPRGEGRGKHTKIEGGGSKGFVGKIFRRKSG